MNFKTIFCSTSFLLAQTLSLFAEDSFNKSVLAMIEQMPQGGGYAATKIATQNLSASLTTGLEGSLEVHAFTAQPSYCSGATYLVFVKAILPELDKITNLTLRFQLVEQMKVRGQVDGVGVWGRWNSNGPCMAKFFKDTNLGYSFCDYQDACPGDFLKIWWRDSVGKDEAGHSVIFLGFSTTDSGEEGIEIWSSNKPLGYGRKVVPYTKIIRHLFSRCHQPENITKILDLPEKDTLLADMLKRNLTHEEVRAWFK